MLIPALLLSGIGFVILHALSPDLFFRQVWPVAIGLGLYMLMRRADQTSLQRLWWVWYGISVFLLVITFFAPEVRGSHRWIDLFGQNIQPSEVMKPFIILALTGFLSLQKKYRLKEFFIYTVLFLIPFFLVLKQPDLGNAIVYLFAYLAILFVSNFPLPYYLIPLAGLASGIPLVWPHLEEYQRIRIVSFINPSYDVQGAGYNAYQALIAVGSGGLWGKGLGAGTQSSLSFLPEFHTDFIFAATIEQIGLAGGIIILLLYAYLLFSILFSVQQGKFARMVVWGFFAQLLIQIIINIGMNTGIVPITGITLPLLSYGGSSIVATYITLGIISSFRKEKQTIIAIR